MSSQYWEQVKDSFGTALAQEPEDREAFLARLEVEDLALAKEVRRLVASHQAAGDFLNQPLTLITSLFQEPSNDQALLAGEILAGRFRIVRLIKKGGMGEIYEAEDQALRERIALKTVLAEIATKPVALERFRRELQFARRISHPNVCRVHEFFEASLGERRIVFYTMELLEGETLHDLLHRQGPLAIEAAIPILSQISEALVASHAADVVHRDLKPANIILVALGQAQHDWRAVVTDFGIAQSANHASAKFDFALQTLTIPGELLGSLPYMAPEQIEGAETTPLTDIYSLGLIMYEVLTGKRPFDGKGFANARTERQRGLPLSLEGLGNEMHHQIKTLIRGCLAVDPRQRIQSANLIRDSLATYRSSLLPEKTVQASKISIAVLPFVHVGHAVEDDYFSDGLTEELMMALATVEGLQVVARTSVFSYRSRNIDVRQIASQLGASVLVEGTVRRNQQKLRITVRLISAAEGLDLWSERYDRQADDIFAIQEDVATNVARNLKTFLRPDAKSHFGRQRTNSIAAHNFFLKGRFFWNKRTEGGLEKAAEYFGHAVAADPDFAPALAGLADCYVIQGIYGTRPPQEVFPLAKDIISRTCNLAPELPEVYCAAGCTQAAFDWDWRASEQSFLRAIELDPAYATAHHWYAINCLVPQGRFSEARTHLLIARENDPLSLPINTTIGLLLYFERRYPEAIHEYLRVLEMDSNFGMTHFFLGQAYEQLGDYAGAISALEHAVTLTGSSAETLALLGRAYALAGHGDRAHDLLGRLTDLSHDRYVSPVLFAQLLLGLNEKERALEFLEQAVDQRAADVAWLNVRPVFDPIRDQARFHALCRKLALGPDPISPPDFYLENKGTSKR